MSEKNYEKKKPTPLETKPVDNKKISERGARILGGAAIKGSGKK